MTAPKKLFIKTYGFAQMNVLTTVNVWPSLWAITSSRQDRCDADMILLTPVHIREKALKKSNSEAGPPEALKELNQSENRRWPVAWRQAKGQKINAPATAVDPVRRDAIFTRPRHGKRVRPANCARYRISREDKFEKLKGRARAKRAPPAFLTVARKGATSSAPSAWCP